MKAKRRALIPALLSGILALGLLACMVMGLVLVWSNIERMDTTYFINIAQNELRERRALRAKLEVERERLLSPYELRRRAEEFGMREPRPAGKAYGNSLEHSSGSALAVYCPVSGLVSF